MAPHPIIVFAFLFQVSSIWLELIHLWSYADNGSGIVIADVFSRVCHGISEVTMSILLICMASGWKLRFQDIDMDEGMDSWIPVTVLVLTVHIILCLLTFVDDDASHKYHDFAGVQGWLLFGLKVLLFLYFSWCIIDARNKAKKSKAQIDYINSLFWTGCCYLLAVPAAILICFMAEAYDRQYVFTLVSQFTMSGANIAMFYMMSSSKSSYRKTSTDDVCLPH